MTNLEQLKLNVLESTYPRFTDEELSNILDMCDDNVNDASYRVCMMKSEATGVKLGPLSVEDNSAFWVRLASTFRTNCTGTVARADGA